MNKNVETRIPPVVVRSRSVSFALTALMVLAAPLAGDGAKAQTVCVDGGTTITCTGSGSTPVSYTNRDIALTLDGSGAAMSIPSVSLISGTYSTPAGSGILSITTEGAVTLSSSTDNTVYLRRYGGTGDASIFINDETTVTRTGAVLDPYTSPGSTFAVGLVNSSSTGLANGSSSRVEIAEGAKVVIDITSSAYTRAPAIAVYAGSAQGDATLINKGRIEASGVSGVTGIDAGGYGSTYVENSGTITIHAPVGPYGSVNKAIGISASAGVSYLDAADAAATSTVKNTGLIQGDAAGNPYSGDRWGPAVVYTGIYNWVGVQNQDVLNEAVVINSGTITGVHDGIRTATQYSGTQRIENSGLIEAEQNGIFVGSENAWTDSESGALSEAKVTTSGRIVTSANPGAKGIFVGSYSGGMTNIALASVTIAQLAGGEIFNRGTWVSEGTFDPDNELAETMGQTAAIYVRDTQKVDISVAGNVRSTEGHGIYAQEARRYYEMGGGASSGMPFYIEFAGGQSTFKTDIETGGVVDGGWKGAGIATLGGDSSTITVHQGGVLGAQSDVAVMSSGYQSVDEFTYWNSDTGEEITLPAVWTEAAPTTITNAGTITGVFKLGDARNIVVNEATGIWNLRSFADTDGNGTRDTFAVAVTDLGASGANSVTNNGRIVLKAHDGSTATLDTTGMYLPAGNMVNAMSLSGPTQAHILGANSFTNNGVIDMTASSAAGDVLVISGGHTAGVNGGGTFYSGGSILMNTVLNEGGANSQSDVLVIDNARVGTAATQLVLMTTGSGTKTVGDGILLVEVLGDVSEPGAFMLGNRIAAGAYEYTLHQGGANGGNWYLTSELIPGGGGVPNYRPEVPMAASIPPLAIEYGYTMLGTLHERVGETFIATAPLAYEERSVYGKDGKRKTVRVPVQQEAQERQKWFSGGWARLIGDRGFHDNNNFAKRGPDYDYTFGGMQAGLDVYGRETAEGGSDKAGFYAGYGQIDANVDGAYGGKAGTVDMDVYSLGAYWTHKDAQGWYTDAVVQTSWYSTDAKSVKGQRLKPDGFGVVASLEGGYAFKLGGGVTVEPQAQLAYQNTSFDDVGDNYGRFSLDNGDSLRGRVGVRLAKTWNAASAAQPRLISAWMRANVWHEFMGRGKTTTTDLFGANAVIIPSSLQGTWGELGAGLTGQVSDSVTLFGTGAYNQSLDNKGRKAWTGRLGATLKW